MWPGMGLLGIMMRDMVVNLLKFVAAGPFMGAVFGAISYLRRRVPLALDPTRIRHDLRGSNVKTDMESMESEWT